jgi:triosephosphate isomerase
MRRRMMAGNWKMHGTSRWSAELAASVTAMVGPLAEAVDVVLAPAFPSLAAVAAVVSGTRLRLAAQDMHWADRGAYTGEVSPLMVAELASHVIVGHSERRTLFAEGDEAVQRKVHAAFAHGLVPILCVGETLPEREAGETDRVVARQLAAACDGLAAAEASRLVVAYEPVWAIGTGRACAPEEAARVIDVVRRVLDEAFGPGAAGTRCLYGGSVTPDNVVAFLAAGADGALVGGASLEAGSFAALVAAAAA